MGLNQYEVRKWDGWHQNITLAMLAQAYLAMVRRKASAQGYQGEREWPRVRQKAEMPYGS